jgi:hypothetical protein
MGFFKFSQNIQDSDKKDYQKEYQNTEEYVDQGHGGNCTFIKLKSQSLPFGRKQS